MAKKRRTKGKHLRVGHVIKAFGYNHKIESKTPTNRFFSKGTAYKVKLEHRQDPILVLGEEEFERADKSDFDR